MTFVAENCLTDKRPNLKLANIFLMPILFAFFTVTDSYNWNCAKRIASTHKKIISSAFNSFEKNPCFSSSLFPNKDLILSNDWVIPTLDGMVDSVPNGDDNSLYSSHYYNPITTDGGASDAISGQLEDFLLLKTRLGQATTDGVGKSIEWLAHYLANMNVLWQSL